MVLLEHCNNIFRGPTCSLPTSRPATRTTGATETGVRGEHSCSRAAHCDPGTANRPRKAGRCGKQSGDGLGGGVGRRESGGEDFSIWQLEPGRGGEVSGHAATGTDL